MHPSAVLHDTGWGHPEHQGRLRALASAVKNDLTALHERVEQVAPAPASVEDLALVHTEALIGTVRGAVDAARSGGRVTSLDADTRVSAASWDAALGTAGAGLEAVRGIARRRYRNAFVAARPPGHHATPDRAMGFCLFNNIAIAAAYLRARGHAERVLIIDLGRASRQRDPGRLLRGSRRVLPVAAPSTRTTRGRGPRTRRGGARGRGSP